MDKLISELNRALTVGEIQDLFADYDRDLKVVFGYTANDYWKTPIASTVIDADLGQVEYSEYHKCLKTVDGEGKEVVVLMAGAHY